MGQSIGDGRKGKGFGIGRGTYASHSLLILLSAILIGCVTGSLSSPSADELPLLVEFASAVGFGANGLSFGSRILAKGSSDALGAGGRVLVVVVMGGACSDMMCGIVVIVGE